MLVLGQNASSWRRPYNGCFE